MVSSGDSNMIVATLTKVLHRYSDLEIQETMRFPNRESAEGFRNDMVNRKIANPVAGSPYTVTAVSF